MSFDVLQDKIRKLKNPTVAGLDARIEYVPEHIRRAAFEEFGVGRRGGAGTSAPPPPPTRRAGSPERRSRGRFSRPLTRTA